MEEEDLHEFLSKVAPPTKDAHATRSSVESQKAGRSGTPEGFLKHTDSVDVTRLKTQTAKVERKLTKSELKIKQKKEEARRQLRELEKLERQKKQAKEAKRLAKEEKNGTTSRSRTAKSGKKSASKPVSAARRLTERNLRDASGAPAPRRPDSSAFNQMLKKMSKVELESEAEIEESIDKDLAMRLILEDPIARQLFFQYLEGEHSEENLLFWEAVELLKSVDKPSLILPETLKIWQEFLSLDPEAPHLINLPSNIHKPMAELFSDRKHYHELHKYMFNPTQQSIYELMKTDSLLRFMKTDDFRCWMTVTLEAEEPTAKISWTKIFL
mmetsp:Transcript_45270/g.113968  ORF Transcript_45270/g.113968 Transcript_45270/m.113968 type:complete len:327 (-) Transcript_45270:35-1015(-)|eukprot:CAMPEP_0177660060 /NCGR_PEP_ID=MMETSP0447-20121125/17799_1 /TAXON_ID=0 /ORGANISM="Stygamoeba regulata, Strain BSH-02190019" /LENGTH=326 /DNA_ID=CAMNT_0019165021 /DNA_START=136 /DNA_END=1116 /DNA_ORIENTATION=+